MIIKTPKCTKAPRHTWSFVKNVKAGSITVSGRGSHGRFTLKGLYRCECGATKHAAPDLNAPGADLRGMVGTVVGTDAIAEGCTGGPVVEPYRDATGELVLPHRKTAKCSYQVLWESINGHGSWATNPWVWCVSFKRLEAA